MPKLLNLIVACAENRVMGRDGKLPWRIPEDFRFFEKETAGKICVLGRVCFETWPRATQDGRRPVVISSRLAAVPGSGVPTRTEHLPRVVRSVAEALAVAEALPGEIYICGGQRVFEETLALPRPLRLHLTLIHAEIPGDVFFPEWRHLAWRESARRESADTNYRYTFFTLDRAV